MLRTCSALLGPGGRDGSSAAGHMGWIQLAGKGHASAGEKRHIMVHDRLGLDDDFPSSKTNAFSEFHSNKERNVCEKCV